MFQMINKIIDGISVAINSEFGDPYEIYTESIEQGLVEPCFSIFQGLSELFKPHNCLEFLQNS